MGKESPISEFLRSRGHSSQVNQGGGEDTPISQFLRARGHSSQVGQTNVEDSPISKFLKERKEKRLAEEIAEQGKQAEYIFGGTKPTAARVTGKVDISGMIGGKGTMQQTMTEAETIQYMATNAQKEYDDYIQSGEYLRAMEAQRQKAVDNIRAGGYAASAGLLRNQQSLVTGSSYAAASGIVEVTPEDEVDNAVIQEAARRKNEADYWKTQLITSQNLEIYNSWPAEDQRLLDVYRSAEYRGPMGELRGFYSPHQRELAKAQLFEKYGEDTVKKIAETRDWFESEENYNRYQEATKTALEKGGVLGYIGNNLVSVPANLVGTFSAPIDYATQLFTRTGQYPTLNPYSEGNLPNVYVGTVREETADAIAGNDKSILRKGAALLYQGGMSAVDNIVRVAAAGKFGSLAMAAAGSFGQTVHQASAQGATPEQAMALGAINAGVEAVTEKIPLDSLFKTAKAGNLKQLLVNVLNQGASELTEEELGLMVTTLTEAAILQEKSSYYRIIQDQMAQGMTYEEAKHFAYMQILKEAGETAAVSFISGGLMEGNNELINYTGTKGTPQQGAQGSQGGDVNPGAVTPQKQIRPQGEQSQPAAEQATPVAATQSGTGLELRAVDKPFVAPGAATVQNETAVPQNTASVPQNPVSVTQNGENDTHTEGRVSGDIMTAQMMSKDIMQVQRLAEATGRDIVFFTKPITEDGVDNGFFENGKIYINVNAQNPIAQIVGHELTHSIEKAGAYKKLSELIMSRIREGGGDIYTLRQQKRDFYAKMGQQLDTTEAIDREIVAEYVGKNLLTDEQTIMEVVQRDRTLGQRIRDWLDRLLAKLGNADAQERAFLTKARDLYAKALSQTQSSFQTQSTTATDTNHDADSWDTNEDMIRWAKLEYAAGRMTDEDLDSLVDSYEQHEQEQLMDSSSAQHSFAGVNAKNADMKALELAKQMEEQEVSSETIRQQTGWFRGMDGKWRWEIDDSKMQYTSRGDLGLRERRPEYARYRELLDKSNRYVLELSDEALTPEETAELQKLKNIWGGTFRTAGRITEDALPTELLSDYVKHDALFEAYPQLRKTRLRFADLPEGTRGQYDPEQDVITLSESLRGKPQDTLIHEIQHVIQNTEDFTSGASIEFWDGQEIAKPEYASAVQKARERVERAESAFRREWADDLNLNLAKQYVELDNRFWSDEMNPDLWQETESRMQQIEQAAVENGWGDLFDDYYYAVGELQMAIERAKLHRRTSIDLYRNTAGEIEARNVAGRRNLTAEQRKNTPPILGGEDTVFAEDTGISFDKELSDYPYNMQTVIQDYLDAVDEGILHFVEEVQSGKAWKSKRVTVGNVSAKMSDAITNLTGVKQQEGNPIILNTGTVEHIMKRHGEKGEADRSMRNKLDLARINYVLQNFDHAELSDKMSFGFKNRDGSPSQNILFSKKINGTYFVVEAVPDTRKAGIVSAYISKNGASQVLDDNAPSSDVRNVPASTPNKMLSQDGNGVKGQHSFSPVENRRVDTQIEDADQESTQEAVKITRDTLPKKAREYLARAEWNLLDKIGQSLSVPRFAQRDPLRGMVQEISNAYLEEGTVPDALIDDLFDRAYEAGVIADREFYDQYKRVKDRMRTNPITISDQDKGDIADYELFRKGTKGALRIVNKGGLPVDSAYRELQEMAPELFPDDITHLADQLMRMFEVSKSIAIAERTLNEHYADDKENFRAWAKNDFAASIGDAMSELRNVKRYAEDRAAKPETETAPKTPEEAEGYYAKLKDARRAYERVMAKNLLTDHDSAIVGKLLTGQITLDSLNPDTDNVKGIAAAYEAKAEYERLTKLLAEYRNSIRAQRREQADGYLETANNWKDKKSGIAYSRETMTRNIEDIVPDRDTAKAINREYFDTVRDAEAEATRFKNKMRDRVRKLNLSRMKKKGNAVSEAHAVQLLGEAEDNIRILERSRGRLKHRDGKTLAEWRAVVDTLWDENPNLDANKIENAVKEFRNIYDEMFVLMNRVRIANGYEPVNYRSGYFPHFQPGDGDGMLAHFGKALGIDLRVTALPTTINGLTHTFKPGIQWFGNAQERLGFNTVYDAVEGFDKYVEGISSVIYQTENIQKLRALSSQARYRTSDDGLRRQVDAVYADPNLTEEQKQAQINEIYNNGKYALSNFVNELDEYTNLLANKKSRLDRTVESLVGRTKLYNIMKWMESRVGANMIAGNLSSAFTNLIPLTQAYGQLSTKNLLHGLWDARRNIIKSDGFVDASAFLTNRRGSDPLVRAWTENVADKLGLVMEIIDNSVSYAVTKGAYYQNLQRGMSEAEAIHQADIFAAKIMAERSKGGMPTLLQSRNPVIKLFTQFQLEVNNQFSEVFKDMPRAYRDKGVLALSFGFLKYFLAAFLFNELYEEVAGRRAALDPIDIARDFINDWKDVGFGEATGNFAVNVLGELPFTSALTLVGIETDGGRYPVSSAIPDIPKLWDAMTDREMSSEKRYEDFWSEIQKPITYLASPFGGGNQISKTIKGLKAYAEGGSYTVDKGSGKDKLQYPIFKDDGDEIWDVTRVAIFGKSSMDEAQSWVDNGFKGLSVKETELYQAMTESGAKDHEVYGIIQEIKAAGKLKGTERKRAERDALAAVKFTEEEKQLAVGFIIGTDMVTDSGNPSEYAKFLNATAQGLSVDQYMEIRCAGAKTDDLLECLDNGMKADEAVEYLMSLEELEAENVEEDLSNVEMWRHAVNFSTVEAVQLMALRGQMNDSQYVKAETATHFDVSLDALVGYYEIRAKYDQNNNGSYSQAEVKAAIDSMGKYHLSTEEKAALWQIVTGTKSAKNNPYSVSIGERVLKYLSKE